MDEPAHSANLAPSTSSPLASLPLDIYDLVADAVSLLPRAVASSTLRSLCFTSRAWCAAAQPVLHSDPYLSFDAPDRVPPRTFQRLQHLLRTLKERPDLAAQVRRFDLGKYTAQAAKEADRRSVSPLSIKLVRVCSNLRWLSIPFVTQLDKADLIAALHQLDSLEEFNYGEGATVVDPWVVNVDIAIKDQWGTALWTRSDFAALAPSWPCLRRLVLQARVRGLERDTAVIPWQLEHVELSLLKNHKLSFPYLDRLLSHTRSSSPTLRHLVLKEHQLHPPDLLELIEAYGAGLVSLSTSTADHFTRNDALFSTISSSCPNLVSLRLGSPVYDLPFVLHELSPLSALRRLTLDTVLPHRPACSIPALADQVRRFAALEHFKLTPEFHGDPGERISDLRAFLKLHGLKKALEGEVEVVIGNSP
ncbi:hypothetical protein JCM8097_004305 [Rhodosporidiobolus ruineniae]